MKKWYGIVCRTGGVWSQVGYWSTDFDMVRQWRDDFQQGGVRARIIQMEWS